MSSVDAYAFLYEMLCSGLYIFCLPSSGDRQFCQNCFDSLLKRGVLLKRIGSFEEVTFMEESIQGITKVVSRVTIGCQPTKCIQCPKIRI